jgi:hypothetical protein
VTAGNVEFVEVVVLMVVSTGMVAAVLRWDDRRAAAGRLVLSSHAWLPATRDAAILGTFLFGWVYGCAALLVHFVKSRWSPAGWGLGLLWSVLLFTATVGAAVAAEATIDWLGL